MAVKTEVVVRGLVELHLCGRPAEGGRGLEDPPHP